MIEKRITNNKMLLSLVVSLLLLLIAGAFVIYKVASPIGNFLFYTFVFYRFVVSKNVVFWTATLFVMVNMPWGLFYYKPFGWYLSLTSSVGISFVTMFGIVFLIKVLLNKKRLTACRKDHFVSFYKAPVMYIFFLILWSLAYGHSPGSLFSLLQALPALLLFFIVPRFFNREELLKFSKIIFLFSIIHFMGSLIEIVRPGSFMSLLYFGTPPIGIDYGNDLIRFVGGITIHLYVMVAGLYYLSTDNSRWARWYLWVVIILSFLFILNSATRGWMIASSFLLLGYFSYGVLRLKMTRKTISSILIIIILGFVLIPDTFKKNLISAFKRLETIEAIAEGDETAKGTLSRLSERGPRVLSKYSESPIFGFGYSKVSTEYYDGHVGNHSMLIMGGIVGLVILWFSVLLIIWFFFQADWRFPRSGFFVFGLAFISIMIIHSSSRAMVSFYMPTDAAYLIGLIFNHFNASDSILNQTLDRQKS
jgi:hypothetical protein